MARPRLKVPPEHKAVAERFRAERVIERFGQDELAREIGVTRPTISNFEYGVSRVSFAAGYAFCRRLDLNSRWLATGEEPRRPFIEARELGIPERELRLRMRPGVDFLTGYGELLQAPIDAWLKKTPLEEIIRRQMAGGPEALARRLSNHDLERRLVETAVGLKNEQHDDMKFAHVKNAEALLLELKARFSVRRSSRA